MATRRSSSTNRDACCVERATAAKRLAGLHHQLGAITAPEWLDAGPGAAGARVVHLDFHPLNVMSTPKGLVVTDWANARRGEPASDVANTWSLLACADPPAGLRG